MRMTGRKGNSETYGKEDRDGERERERGGGAVDMRRKKGETSDASHMLECSRTRVARRSERLQATLLLLLL